MKESKVIVFEEERVSISFEENLKKYLLSFPVTNGMVDYLEVYEISEEEYIHFASPEGRQDLANLTKLCKNRQGDDRLLVQPSKIRGTPC